MALIKTMICGVEQSETVATARPVLRGATETEYRVPASLNTGSGRDGEVESAGWARSESRRVKIWDLEWVNAIHDHVARRHAVVFIRRTLGPRNG